jgi:hypothetical protein
MQPDVPPTLVRILHNLTAKRADGTIDTDTWAHAFAQTLSQYHLAAYAHGAEIGLNQLTPEDHKLVQSVIDKQLEFLDGYKQAWEEGRYDGREETALHRSDMYADATLGTWWMGQTRGWPLPAWPGDGTTQCKTRCRCSWDIQPPPEGVGESEDNADAYWLLGNADHCQTCLQRSEEWAPLRIRGGELQL